MVPEEFSIHDSSLRPLHHTTGLGVGAALLLLVVSLALWILPLPDASRIVCALKDIGHVALGAIMAAAFRALLLRGAGMGSVGATLVGFLLAVGGLAAAEVIQPFFGGETSMNDVIAGAAGATGVTLFALARRPGAAIPFLAVVLGTAVFAFGARRGIMDIVDALGQKRELPLLAGFEHELEMSRWKFVDAQAGRVKGHQTQGAWSLEARVAAGRIGNLVFAWPIEGWCAWDAFAFDIQSDGVGLLRVSVHVLDPDSDGTPANRFEGEFLVDPAGSTIQIPLSEIAAGPAHRRLDLSHVKGVVIVVDGTSAERVVHVDNVRLVREPR